MSFKDLDSIDSDSISSNLNDDFARFLDEPLTSSSDANENSGKVQSKKEKVETLVGETSEIRHTWLKKESKSLASGGQSVVQESLPRLSPEQPKVQVFKRKKSSSEENPSESEESQLSEVQGLSHQESSKGSSDIEENLSFQVDLQKAIDHSLQGTQSEDDYSTSFEKSHPSSRSYSVQSVLSDQVSSSSKSSNKGEKDALHLYHASQDDPVFDSESTVSGQSVQSGTESETKEEKDDEEEEEEEEDKLVLPFTETFAILKTGTDEPETPHIISSSGSTPEKINLSMSEDLEPPLLAAVLTTEEFILQQDNKDLSVAKEQENKSQAIRVSATSTTDDHLSSTFTTLLKNDNPEEFKESQFVKTKSILTTPTKTRTDVWSRLYPTAAPRSSSATSKSDFVVKTRPVTTSKTRRMSPTRGTLVTRDAPYTPKGKSNRGGLTRGGRQPSISESEIERLKQEVAEQERLLNGFQNENEKLYEEMRVKNHEVQEIKEAMSRTKEQLNWQISNLKERIRFLEFGNQTSVGTCSSLANQCEHFQKLKEMQNENTDLKEEIDKLKSSVLNIKSTKITAESLPEVPDEEVRMLREQLTKTEQMAADLQVQLTDALQSEKNLQSRLETLSRKQSSSQTVAFLEEHLRKIFQFQEVRDSHLKELLDDVHKHQNLMKLAYQDAIREIEENFQEQRLGLEIKLREYEENRGGFIRLNKQETLSKQTQCNDLALGKEGCFQISGKHKSCSAYVQCNLVASQRRGTQNKIVQCYLGDASNSNIALENKELKLRVERLLLEQEDYKKQVEDCLIEMEQQRPKIMKKQDLKLDHFSREYQQQTIMESQQILLEQIQRRLEGIQGQWERQVNENTSLKHRLQQTTTELIKAEEKIQGTQPGLKNILLLERKIAELEKRHAQREEELSELQFHAGLQSVEHLNKEVAKWQEQVLQKNRIISHYQKELDTIIAFLYQLQQQSTTVPQDW